MTEIILPGAIHRESEFVRGLTGACGPNALSMGARWSTQAATPATYDVYTDMYRRGLCAASGASTLDALHQEAQALGLPLTAYRGYGEPWPADGMSGWRAFYTFHAGHSYILMETANGQALRDSISGQGENAVNLRYHFIGVVGHHDGGYSARVQRDLPSGWWACDGDNYASGDVLQFYPDDVMAAAQPCGALAFGAKVSMQVAWTRQSDGTARDGAGHTAGTGLASALIGNTAPDGKRSETPYNAAGDVFVDLVDGQVYTWNHSEGARTDRGGLVIEALEAQIANRDAAIDLRDGAIDLLNKQLATLKAAPQSAPTDPQTVKDAALGKGLRALLEEAAA